MRASLKILARGWLGLGPVLLSTVAVAAPGQLDVLFGNSGKLSLDIGCNSQFDLPATVTMARDAQGSLYLVGFCSTAPPGSSNERSVIKVIKTDANGTRVGNFGSDGIATIITPNPNGYETATAVTIDANTDLYIVGQNGNGVGAVWKVDGISGTLVSGFGNGGVQSFGTGQFSAPNAVLLDSHGYLYVGGENYGTIYEFAVAKLDTSGNLVTGFGTGGTAHFSVNADDSHAVSAMALDSAGYLYAAGEVGPGRNAGADNYDFALAKLDSASGALIGGFGTAGIQTYELGNNNDDLVSAIVLDGTGDAYIGGVTSVAIDDSTSLEKAALIKVGTGNGELVGGFGSGGIRTLDLTGNGSVLNALAWDGTRLYLGGGQVNAAADAEDLLAAELDASGALVAGFGVGGSTTVPINGFDEVDTLLLDGFGHMYLGGISLSFSEDPALFGRTYVAARLLTANNVSVATLVSSLNPAQAGSSVTFTATVSGSGGTPGGHVSFYDGNSVICANVTLAGGHASCTTATLAAAPAAHAITVSYGGDGTNLGSVSAVLVQNVLGNEIFHSGFE